MTTDQGEQSNDVLPDGSRPVLEVARGLLGARVSAGGVTVRLCEVEAYAGSDDPGAHGFRGQTPRNSVMFGPPGHLYVYFTYGMHHCLNIVSGPQGYAAGVLLRAGEVVSGHGPARARRGAVGDRDLARGPARLAQALGVGDLSLNGTDLRSPDSPVRVEGGAPVPDAAVRTGPRVGVSGPGGDAAAYPWRFWIGADPHVSAYRPSKPRRRTGR